MRAKWKKGCERLSRKTDLQGPERGLELPFGHLIRGIARSRGSTRREEAAAAYLLALAAQRYVDGPEDRLAVAAMATRTRRELLGHESQSERGECLSRVAGALVAGSAAEAVDALQGVVGWYAARARDSEAREIAQVARQLAGRVVDRPDLSTRACRWHGWLSLECGRLKEALDAFRQAVRLGREAGCRSCELRAALGLAHVDLGRGRIGRARSGASRVLDTALDRGEPALIARAYRSLFAIERRAGEFEQALEYGWRALRASARSPSKGRLLVECARLLAGLGLEETARNVYEGGLRQPLAMRDRFAAEVGLLELDVSEGNEVAFLRRRKALEETPGLAEVPLWHARFWMAVGRGSRRFGKTQAAARALDEAAWLAEWNGLAPVLFEVQEEMEGAMRAPGRPDGPESEGPAYEELARRFGGAELA